MNVLKNSVTLIFFILIIVFFFVIAFRSNKLDNDLKKNGVITKGKIFKATHGKNTMKFLYYNFIDEKGLTHENSIGVELKNKEYFIGRSFPVVFLPEDAENNCLLVTRQYFEIYGIVFPDSLNWVDDYVY